MVKHDFWWFERECSRCNGIWKKHCHKVAWQCATVWCLRSETPINPNALPTRSVWGSLMPLPLDNFYPPPGRFFTSSYKPDWSRTQWTGVCIRLWVPQTSLAHDIPQLLVNDLMNLLQYSIGLDLALLGLDPCSILKYPISLLLWQTFLFTHGTHS